MTAQDARLERLIAFCETQVRERQTLRGQQIAWRLLHEFRAKRRPEVMRAIADAQWRKVNGL